MTTQAQPESPTIEAFDGSSLPGLLDADELLAVGFLRLRLHAHAHQVVSDRVRQALAALEQAGHAIDGCYRDGDDGGLPAGCHYFPTNDLAGTRRNSDGHHEGLWFAKTWDYRARFEPRVAAGSRSGPRAVRCRRDLLLGGGRAGTTAGLLPRSSSSPPRDDVEHSGAQRDGPADDGLAWSCRRP